MKNLFNRFVRDEEGQDIIEYALLAAFISIVAWLILVDIGTDVSDIYQDVQAATADASAAN
jgi:Flp pilus assembly pilin Flp